MQLMCEVGVAYDYHMIILMLLLFYLSTHDQGCKRLIENNLPKE